MFTNIIFIFIVLLLSGMVPGNPEESNPAFLGSFAVALSFYLILLLFICIQSLFFSKFSRRIKTIELLLVNLELISYFCFYQFYFEAPKFLGTVFSFPNAFIILTLYFLGLAVFHYVSSNFSVRYTKTQFYMNVPFILPFLLIVLCIDLLYLFPNDHLHALLTSSDSTITTSFLTGAVLIFMVLMMVFIPFFIQKIWQCKPMEPGPLKDRLNHLCEIAHFKHAGIKTWTVMNESLTAAIMGIVPRIRYVMFTKRILNELSPEALEAVLAHEIGHSYRRHLLIYPFIIFGMFVCTGLFTYFLGDKISNYFYEQYMIDHSTVWKTIDTFAIFVTYALIIALYFRFVFGYFSRLFERQADLHVFKLGLKPESMVEALDQIGTRTGNTHKVPSWHHYSIQQRIDFIRSIEKDPQQVEKYHRWVRINVTLYFILFFLAILFLYSS